MALIYIDRIYKEYLIINFFIFLKLVFQNALIKNLFFIKNFLPHIMVWANINRIFKEYFIINFMFHLFLIKYEILLIDLFLINFIIFYFFSA